MSTPLLILLAIVPALAIASYIYIRDIREPEPSGLLVLTLLYGATAFFISRGIGFLLHNFIYTDDSGAMQQLISAFVFVGLLGEGFKFLFLRGITFYYKSFNQPFDGIVYSIMMGMGYAAAENILYVINGDLDTTILRITTAAPANAVFAVIMGYFLGEAKLTKSKMFLYSLLALLLAAFAHGYYDYFMQMMNVKGLWMQAGISLVIVVVLTQMAFKRRKDSVIKT
ncbi:MAG: PrsW family intramembrane metalloprotease [Saprospiraceae bacterium]|nr:PrsW family intramembrane metalloprotease [Candidatus Opimibacter iunctus]